MAGAVAAAITAAAHIATATIDTVAAAAQAATPAPVSGGAAFRLGVKWRSVKWRSGKWRRSGGRWDCKGRGSVERILTIMAILQKAGPCLTAPVGEWKREGDVKARGRMGMMSVRGSVGECRSSCRRTPPSHPDPTTRPVRTLCGLAASVAMCAHSRQLCVGVVLFWCSPATLQPFYAVPSQNHAKTALPAVANKTTVVVSGGGLVPFCFLVTQRWSLLSPQLRPWLSGW